MIRAVLILAFAASCGCIVPTRYCPDCGFPDTATAHTHRHEHVILQKLDAMKTQLDRMEARFRDD